MGDGEGEGGVAERAGGQVEVVAFDDAELDDEVFDDESDVELEELEASEPEDDESDEEASEPDPDRLEPLPPAEPLELPAELRLSFL